MKLLSEMSSVEAISPPTLTCAPAPKNTPFWLTRNNWPLASRLPSMLLAAPPVTRFRVTALELGWTNWT